MHGRHKSHKATERNTTRRRGGQRRSRGRRRPIASSRGYFCRDDQLAAIEQQTRLRREIGDFRQCSLYLARKTRQRKHRMKHLEAPLIGSTPESFMQGSSQPAAGADGRCHWGLGEAVLHLDCSLVLPTDSAGHSLNSRHRIFRKTTTTASLS